MFGSFFFICWEEKDLIRSQFKTCLNLYVPSSLILPVNDTLDEIFDESEDEEESQSIVNQVLDEIGIEITGKVRSR